MCVCVCVCKTDVIALKKHTVGVVYLDHSADII